MKLVTTTLDRVQPGETIIRAGKREINARFVAAHDVPVGYKVRGPRGGQYALTISGARQLVRLETTDTGRPNAIVSRTATVVVLRPAS